MGCAQSKIENEEAVTRCKERKLLMKEAVTARNAFAAAHSAYAMALKNTGAALSDYSHGEFLVSSNHSYLSAAAAVASTSSLPSTLSPPSAAAISNSAASSSSAASVAIPQPIPDNLPPPPPPPPPSLQRAATMPEKNGRSGGIPSGSGLNGTVDHDDDDDDDSELENRERLIRKSRSRGGSNRGARKIIEDHHQEEKAPPPPPANPRPIPPPRQQQHQQHQQQQQQQQQQQPFYDYFFPNVESMPGTTLEDTPQPQPTRPVPPRPHSPLTEEEEDDEEDEDGEEEEEEEETEVERKSPVEERPKRVEEVSVDLEKASNFRGMQKNKEVGIAGERRGGRISVTNLANVFNEIDDSFLKASESAHEVSKMLEATRLHYHSNFADNRGI